MAGREGLDYFGFATNAKGQWEQLRVTFPDNKMTQEWTGVIYKSFKHADGDVGRLNMDLARDRDRRGR